MFKSLRQVPPLVQAAIVVIGDEILAGRTQDTNSHYLAERLQRLGIETREVRVVGDEAVWIQRAVWELGERRQGDLVFTTGGLGPTHDDRTVAAIAAMHGRELTNDPVTWRRVQERARALHKSGGRPSPDPGPWASKVALVPHGAQTFANPAGAAPGFALKRRLRLRQGDAWTLVLPGVPQELRAVWLAGMERFVAGLVPAEATAAAPITRRFVCDAQESDLAPLLAAVETQHPEVRVGSYPNWGSPQVGITLTGPEGQLPEAQAALAERLASIDVALTPLQGQQD